MFNYLQLQSLSKLHHLAIIITGLCCGVVCFLITKILCYIFSHVNVVVFCLPQIICSKMTVMIRYQWNKISSYCYSLFEKWLRSKFITFEVELSFFTQLFSFCFLQFSYEQLFRSLQFTLLDNACREYLFISEFFMLSGASAAEMFNFILGKTLDILLVCLTCRSSCFVWWCLWGYGQQKLSQDSMLEL